MNTTSVDQGALNMLRDPIASERLQARLAPIVDDLVQQGMTPFGASHLIAQTVRTLANHRLERSTRRGPKISVSSPEGHDKEVTKDV